MKPRLQYLVANGQLVLASRRPSRLYRCRRLLIGGAGLLVVILVAMEMGPH